MSNLFDDFDLDIQKSSETSGYAPTVPAGVSALISCDVSCGIVDGPCGLPPDPPPPTVGCPTYAVTCGASCGCPQPTANGCHPQTLPLICYIPYGGY